MIQRFALHIALRYARSSCYNRFALLIQRLSILGIAIGVSILIIISSIFNGFRHEIQQALHAIKPHMIVHHSDFWWQDWQPTLATLKKQPAIISAIPRIRTYGVIAANLNTPPVQIIASGLAENPSIATKSATKPLSQQRRDPIPQAPVIIDAGISHDLASSLGLQIDDRFSIMTANPTTTDGDSQPIALRVRITQIETQPLMTDQRSIYLSAQALSKALGIQPTTINEIVITTKSIETAPLVQQQLYRFLPEDCSITDVSASLNSLIASLAMQRSMMIIVLSLVVIVAACNLVTSLVMIVMERKQEIALLQTMGVTQKQILMIFILQSLLLTTTAVAIGITVGVTVANFITGIVTWIEQTFQIILISDQVFMLNYLPSRVAWQDVVAITLATYLLAILSAIYPAYLASNVQPAETLRYE